MDDLEKKIRERLEELRVHLQADGGDLQIVEVSGKTVQVKLRGACGCCPHATPFITNHWDFFQWLLGEISKII